MNKKILVPFIFVGLLAHFVFGEDTQKQNAQEETKQQNENNSSSNSGEYKVQKIEDKQETKKKKQSENATDDISSNIIKSASSGREVVIERRGEEEKKKEENKELYRQAVILNWNDYFIKQNLRGKEVLGKTAANSFVKNVTQTEGDCKDEAGKEDEKTAAVKGYCFITDDINVGKQPASLRTECQTNYGAITLFGNLVNLNDKASLILDVKYIEKDGFRFPVTESIVTNEEKTSYNIATFVNDRKVAEIALASTSSATDEIKTYTNQYLKALEQSKTKQQLAVSNMSNGTQGYPVTSTLTNTEKPDPLSYLAIAGTNIVTSIVKTTADTMKKDLPYYYQIVGKTKIWIDLRVKQEGEYVK